MLPTLTYRVHFVAFVSLICLGLFAASSYGQTPIAVSWTDSTGNWSVPANWNPAVVPNNSASATYDVTIRTSNSVVTMDVLDDTIDNLTLGATNTLNINAGRSISLVKGGGVSTNFGTLNNTGTINITGNKPVLLINEGSLNNTGTLNNNYPSQVSNLSGMLTNEVLPILRTKI